MSRKEPEKRKDDLCDPGPEKKQRSIAMAGFKQYCDNMMKMAPEKVNTVLETIERLLPEGVTMVRDEPLPDKSEPEQLWFASVRGTPMILLCTLRKGNFELSVTVEAHLNFEYVSLVAMHPYNYPCLVSVRRLNDVLASVIKEIFRQMSERREPPIGCADSATKTHVPLK